MTMNSKNNYRRSTTAAIHIIKNELGMDDDAYRDALAMNFNGKRSATQLDDQELKRWLLHLKSLQNRAGLNTEGVRNEAMIKKCEALWISLRKLGAVKNGDKAALDAFVVNHTGAAGIRMANSSQLYKAIEALKSWSDRTKKEASHEQARHQ